MDVQQVTPGKIEDIPIGGMIIPNAMAILAPCPVVALALGVLIPVINLW